MPLQATSGAASYDGFGGGVVDEPNYIESCFSTYLYTNDTYPSNLTITNGIDLSGKGGLVWMKNRSLVRNHNLYDTARGALKQLRSDGTDGDITNAGGYGLTAFNANGFSLGTDIDGENVSNVVSWTFRKQPKFFDIVTYTGNGAIRNIAHNLGSVPGFIIVKRLDTARSWAVYHRSLGANKYLNLNATTGVNAGDYDGYWNLTEPTSTVFTVRTDGDVNTNGGSYVAYLFAHDAGGFGLTGTDNVISCGGFTADGSGNATVSLGYEPQWILTKRTSSATDWQIYDNMRKFTADNVAQTALRPNLSTAESGSFSYATNSTGFSLTSVGASNTFIYIAIRRSPMKTPTVGTSVYSPIAYTGNSTSNTTVQNLTTSFSGDAVIISQKTGSNNDLVFDKLRGGTQGLYTSLTLAEENIATTYAGQSVGFNNTQTVLTGKFTNQGNYNYSGDVFIGWNFKRAPSFFDEVCTTADGSGNVSFTHNLGVAPDFAVIKCRSSAGFDWWVYSSQVATPASLYGRLNGNGAFGGAAPTIYYAVTSTTFQTFTGGWTGNNSTTVAYLFATCAGVSKCGAYTGTGTTLQIDCGFTGGARFVLIRRTNVGSSDWYVWDSARGIVSGNDPYLLLNSTAAEVTSTDYIDTYSAGFEISSTAPAAINGSGDSFIFLAIA
jgi:hypothetical protein